MIVSIEFTEFRFENFLHGEPNHFHNFQSSENTLCLPRGHSDDVKSCMTSLLDQDFIDIPFLDPYIQERLEGESTFGRTSVVKRDSIFVNKETHSTSLSKEDQTNLDKELKTQLKDAFSEKGEYFKHSLSLMLPCRPRRN